MTLLLWLVPIALGMGLVGLLAFLWSMKSGQLEGLDGAAERVLLHDLHDVPRLEEPRQRTHLQKNRGKHARVN